MSSLKERVDSLASRQDEFRGKQRELNKRQESIEAEMLELRSKQALAELSESESMRLDSLRDQSSGISSDLREILRLKKMNDSALSAATTTLASEVKALEREKAIRRRDEARNRLDGDTEALRVAAATFAATWATAQEETQYLASNPNLILKQLDMREHSDRVEAAYDSLQEQYNAE